MCHCGWKEPLSHDGVSDGAFARGKRVCLAEFYLAFGGGADFAGDGFAVMLEVWWGPYPYFVWSLEGYFLVYGFPEFFDWSVFDGFGAHEEASDGEVGYDDVEEESSGSGERRITLRSVASDLNGDDEVIVVFAGVVEVCAG